MSGEECARLTGFSKELPDGRPLQDVAEEFATELADTVSRFLGQECRFTCSAIDGGRFNVAEENDGIPLTIDGQPVLVLSVDIYCYWDSRETYLAVEASSFKVFAGRQQGEPLFRYDFLRDPANRNIPCAHLQIGAHRDEFTHALGYGGYTSRRAKTRAAKPPGRAPKISEVHFPLGGPRFRPCLEDILAMTREEFGIDTATDWASVIDKGRRSWRLKQVAAAVHDCPEEAARVLQDLGYAVEASTPAQENTRRLTQA
jgi:hypothetical protein